MNTRMNGHESDVVQLRRASAPANDQLDTAGQTILQMIDRAAGVAEEHSRHALEMAQKFSNELRAAEDRVAELEAELASYRERADRAEQWLHRVYTEIEERFLRQNDARRGVPQRRKTQGLDRICTNKEPVSAVDTASRGPAAEISSRGRTKFTTRGSVRTSSNVEDAG